MLPDGNRVKHIHTQNSTIGMAIFCVHPLQHLAHLGGGTIAGSV